MIDGHLRDDPIVDYLEEIGVDRTVGMLARLCHEMGTAVIPPDMRQPALDLAEDAMNDFIHEDPRATVVHVLTSLWDTWKEVVTIDLDEIIRMLSTDHTDEMWRVLEMQSVILCEMVLVILAQNEERARA